VRGSARGSVLSPTTQGLGLFLAGTIVSLLLFALILVLTRSRERAMGMVQEKTGQLRHQALHDALTDLPNRVLALDRAEQMLARARRQHVPVAALSLDIDGSTLDVDPEMVAERLREVLRQPYDLDSQIGRPLSISPYSTSALSASSGSRP
jgi:predicted signal transduction protein with EAL and GGDEF domain